jgi:hypothetical protein
MLIKEHKHMKVDMPPINPTEGAIPTLDHAQDSKVCAVILPTSTRKNRFKGSLQ